MNLEKIEEFQCSEETLKKFDIPVKDKKELVNLVNESIFRKCCKTNKEKLDLLDLRDKLLKLIRFETNLLLSNSENEVITNITGTCEDMCPEKERYSRECLSLYHRFEIRHDITTNTDIVDHRLMIKEYSRSSADQDLPLPNEMRPIHVLFGTMMYLIDEIISKISLDKLNSIESEINEMGNEFSIGDWYDFIWNRTRSIRKDIIQQRLLLKGVSTHSASNNIFLVNGLGGVIIIEQCARFHIMCAHRLCEQTSQVFDFKINEENLKNCFQSLRQYYEFNQTLVKPSPYEAEFRSYGILLNLNQSNILCEIQRWPQHIRHSDHVRFALNIYFAYNSRNYVKFFRLVASEKCQYLHACILHRYFYDVRCSAFKTIFTAYKDSKEKIFPLTKLISLLGFDDENEAYDYCNLFGLQVTDELNVLMRSSMSYDNFKLTKSNQDRLKNRRSFLLVESKFKKKLFNNSKLTINECLSEIISGQKFEDGTKQASIYGIKSNENYKLHSSFNEDGYYCSDEISQYLEMVKFNESTRAGAINIKKKAPNKILVKKIRENIMKPKTETANSGNQLKVMQKPNTLVRRTSIKKTAKALTGETPKTKERTKSASSTSSNASSTGFKAIKKAPTVLAQPLEQNKPASFEFKPSNTQFETKPTEASSFLTRLDKSAPNTNPFASIVQPPRETTKSLFGIAEPQTTTTTTFTNPFQELAKKKLHEQPKSFPTSIFGSFQKPETSKNLFENIIKKNEQQPSSNDEQISKEISLNNKSESFFQSLILEIVKEFAREFLYTERQYSENLANDLMETVLKDMYKTIAIDEINTLKQQRQQFEVAKKKENEFNLIKLQRINTNSEFIYNSLLDLIVKETCENYLNFNREAELIVYDDILMNLFQHEFEIIIKQIANEINNELILEKLAENIYFNWNENGTQLVSNDYFFGTQSKIAIEDEETDSIFMHDLRSYLNECIYEFTRLNLNVNREFYYELKQGLNLNHKVYLFRKWRLKLSLKLLTVAHRRASLSLKSIHSPSPNKEATNQLNLISFMKSYGSFLANNLKKLQKINSFLIPNSFYSFDYEYLMKNFDINYDFNMIKLLNYSIVHCEPYQIYLSWNFKIDYKNILYDLLLDNYFNIVHNKEKFLIMPPPMNVTTNLLPINSSLSSSPLTSFSSQKDFSNLNFPMQSITNTELYIKTVVTMPSLSDDQNDDNIQTIKRWLLAKFFRFNSKNMTYETQDLENFCINNLKSSKFSLKFCIKLCTHQMSNSEYLKKQKRRSFYGANSMIFVLMPPENQDINEYLQKNRKSFYQILSLFNENIKFSDETNTKILNTYEFMFISYLENNAQTKTMIEQIFGNNQLDNYCYCLLEGDAIKDNGILQRTYQFFLQKICIKYANVNFTPSIFTKASLNYEHVNNVTNLADLFEITCIKFLDFLANHPLRNSIYIPLKKLIEEFNNRVDKLLKFITNDAYKTLTWPIPEMVDYEQNICINSSASEITSDYSTNSLWMLKYWNTTECIDNVLNKQFYNLVHLDDFSIEFESDANSDELIEFTQIEISIFKYLHKTLKQKNLLNETEKSIFQLESSVKCILNSMKKSIILNNLKTSITPNNVFKIDNARKSIANENSNKLLVEKSSIEWSKLLIPIVEHLLANGFLKFRHIEKIYLNQFYIYYNLNEIKSYDWINNCIQMQLSPNSSASTTTNLVSPIQTSYLINNYPRRISKIDSDVRQTSKNQKRRYSDESALFQQSKESAHNDDQENFKEIENTSIIKNLDFEISSEKIKSVKQFKRQIGSPLCPKVLETKEFDDKLNQFLDLLNTEKENNFKFESRLNKVSTDKTESKGKTLDESNESINKNNNDLDNFLEEFNQEKLKNEEFNLKLNQMLNYSQF